MTDLFFAVLNMSISASWLILAVLLLRPLCRKAPKWLPCVLWGIVAVRLLCPLSIESAVSLIPSARTITPVAAQSDAIPAIDSGVSLIDNTINPLLQGSMSGSSDGVRPDVFSPDNQRTAANPPSNGAASYEREPMADDTPAISTSTRLADLNRAAGIVWFIGMLGMAAFSAVSYLRFRRRLRESIPLQDGIRICDTIDSPLIFGVLHPMIYLPSSLTEEDSSYVLAHERAHLQRGDHLWKPLGYLVLCIHWFNPLVWIAYLLLCRDIELACDERVIRTLEIREKKAYAEALLSCSTSRRAVLSCPLAFGEVGVKERVRAVLSYRKRTIGVVLLAAALCVIVAVCFLTNPFRTLSFPEEPVEFEMADGEGYIYLVQDGREYLPFMPLKPSLVDRCIGYYMSDNEPTYVCSVKGQPVESWVCDTLSLTNCNEVMLYRERSVTDIPAGFVSQPDYYWNTDDITRYATDYIGDATKVSAIAQRLPYPQGYSYRSIALQTTEEPYELKIYLLQEKTAATDTPDFGRCADWAFDLIGNLSVVTFYYGDYSATYVRDDAIAPADGEPARIDTAHAETTERLSGPYYDLYEIEDLDGDGTREAFRIANAASYEPESPYMGALTFYLNGEAIYYHEDLCMILPDGIGSDAALLDLDGDGTEEIFFTFHPSVNSAELVEYAVLKETPDGWIALEMPKNQENPNPDFPITITAGTQPHTAIISCDGTAEQIVYDYTAHYEGLIQAATEDSIDGFAQEYQEILDTTYTPGTSLGGSMAWDIWAIRADTYAGNPCLIATQGLEGNPLGKYDSYGTLDIYFDYDAAGHIHILHLAFQEW